MAAVDGDPPWMAALRLMAEHAVTLFRVMAVMRDEIVQLGRGVQARDADALLLLGAVGIAHRAIECPTPGQPAMPCLSCARSLAGVPRSYAVVWPEIPEPEFAVALAICGTCGPDLPAIVEAVQPCLRLVWPAHRRLPPMAPGGCA